MALISVSSTCHTVTLSLDHIVVVAAAASLTVVVILDIAVVVFAAAAAKHVFCAIQKKIFVLTAEKLLKIEFVCTSLRH